MIFTLLIVLGVFYLIFIRQPSLTQSLNRQAFFLNFSALKNGIYLANIRFITNHQLDSPLDRWISNNIGLDFNQKGFPIGTDVTNNQQQTPLSSNDCLTIWKFVLGPLQPKIFLTHQQDSYHARLSKNNICIYISNQLDDAEIHYNALTGKVYFFE